MVKSKRFKTFVLLVSSLKNYFPCKDIDTTVLKEFVPQFVFTSAGCYFAMFEKTSEWFFDIYTFRQLSQQKIV